MSLLIIENDLIHNIIILILNTMATPEYLALCQKKANEIRDLLDNGCPELDRRFPTLFPYDKHRLAMHLLWLGQEISDDEIVRVACKHLVSMGFTNYTDVSRFCRQLTLGSNSP